MGNNVNEHSVWYTGESGHICFMTAVSGGEVCCCTDINDPEAATTNMFSFDEPGYESGIDVAEKIDVGATSSVKIGIVE